jgi:hypothetical protein
MTIGNPIYLLTVVDWLLWPLIVKAHFATSAVSTGVGDGLV